MVAGQLYIICFFSICTCLASLLSIWLVFGNFDVRVRCWVCSLATPAIGLLVCVGIGEMEAEWLVLVALICGGVAVFAVMESKQLDPGLIWALIVVTHSALLAYALRRVRHRGYLLARIGKR